MRIDKRLNLIIPVQRDDASEIFVHSSPITAQTFDLYFEVISATWNRLMTGGHFLTGPLIADKMLRKVAQEMGVWDTDGGVEHGLVAAIHQRTNVLTPGTKGWDLLPLDQSKKALSDEDAAKIEAAITFFTVASALLPPSTLQERIGGIVKMWGARLDFCSCTELRSSLQTLTAAASSGVTVTAS